MKLKGRDIRQLDEEALHRLRLQDPARLEQLSINLLADLKEALERLEQSPHNSSRPPSTRDPWWKAEDAEPPPDGDADGKDTDADDGKPGSDDKKPAKRSRSRKNEERNPPGRQKGSPGFARSQTLPITDTARHFPVSCACCSQALPADQAKCYTAYEVCDLEFGSHADPSVRLINTKHLFFETACSCGHVTREEPYRAAPDHQNWEKVALTEWRLCGPGLAGFLSWMHFRMRASARQCREFMFDVFGLELSVGVIQQSFHETARANEPVYERLIEEIGKADQIFCDETPHKQAGEPLWLWTVLSLSTVIFSVGRRTKEVFHSYVSPDFAGWLMSDGYRVYREFALRLRCWAHLIRKAKGLAETYTPHVQGYGRAVLEILDTLMDAVHQARASPGIPLPQRLSGELEQLKTLCEKMARSKNEKARQLGREFLNDWDAIFRVLENPQKPLTNNIAERILRHWVILRRITYGTRTVQGSYTLSITASVIETCRLRNASPLRYLQQVIAARRAGLDAPPLPPIPPSAEAI